MVCCGYHADGKVTRNIKYWHLFLDAFLQDLLPPSHPESSTDRLMLEIIYLLVPESKVQKKRVALEIKGSYDYVKTIQ